MKKVHLELSKTNKIKLNSYHPLCATLIGKRAVEEFGFNPFIDGSCRREPDFEHEFPSISALCRQGSFAPHLKEGDIVVYMTVGGKVAPYKQGHHLVAILQVEKVYPSHKDGEIGYLSEGLKIPSNCMSSSKGLHSFHKTMGNYKNKKEVKAYLKKEVSLQKTIGAKRINSWNKVYLDKSVKWPCFVRTKKLYINTENPPFVSLEFIRIFGKLPGTQTPKNITSLQLEAIGKIVGIQFEFKHLR